MTKTMSLAFAGVSLLACAACTDASSDAATARPGAGAGGTGSAGSAAGGSASGGQAGQAGGGGGGAAGGSQTGGTAGASGSGGACASVSGGATAYKVKGRRYDPVGKCVHALEPLPGSICQVTPPPPNTNGLAPAIVVSPDGACYFVDRSTDGGFCGDGWKVASTYFSPFCGGMAPLSQEQSDACGSELLASAPVYKACSN